MNGAAAAPDALGVADAAPLGGSSDAGFTAGAFAVGSGATFAFGGTVAGRAGAVAAVGVTLGAGGGGASELPEQPASKHVLSSDAGQPEAILRMETSRLRLPAEVAYLPDRGVRKLQHYPILRHARHTPARSTE